MGLRAGRGIIGTAQEEDDFYKLMEDEDAEIVSGDDAQEGDEEMQIEQAQGQSQQQAEEADDENMEDSEDEGADTIVLPDGVVMAVSQYFGGEWEQMIVSTTLADTVHTCPSPLAQSTYRGTHGSAREYANNPS